MSRFRQLPSSSSTTPAEVSVWERVKLGVQGISRICFLITCQLVTAGLFYVSYPRVSFAFAAWFILAPFIWGLCHVRRCWGAFFYGWATGFLSNAFLLSWIYYTCVHGGGLSVPLALGAWLGLAALLGLQFAAFACGCYFLKKMGPFFPLLAACGWVALEWLHQTIAFYGLGFPWVMLGYTQWNVPEVLYLASYGGVYLISFVLAFVGATAGWFLQLPSLRQGLWQLSMAVGLFALLFGFGRHIKNRQQHWLEHPHALLSVQAALLQPNIDQYKKWTPQFETEIAHTLEQMGQTLAGKNTYLAVWPESTVPGALTQQKYADLFANIGKTSGAYQIIGSNIEVSSQEQYVGAYLMPPTADGLSAYRKTKLVPFGEFIPLENLVKKIARNVEVLGALGSFMPGPFEQPLLDAGGVKLGTTICYESIFPQLWRAQNKNGAQLFVNITNDAWFFDTDAPYQHLAANVLRAVENARPVLRAANTGFSAYIDPFGTIQAKSGLFTQEILTVTVPLSVREGSSFYAKWGDWFAWICAVLFFTIGISTVVFFYE